MKPARHATLYNLQRRLRRRWNKDHRRMFRIVGTHYHIAVPWSMRVSEPFTLGDITFTVIRPGIIGTNKPLPQAWMKSS